MSLRIDDQLLAAFTALNLGNAYEELPALRDLDQAEHWYRRSLDLIPEHDQLGQSRSVSMLGYVAWERFKEARAARKPEKELLRHLDDAAGFYLQALDLLPPTAVNDLGVVHNQLGNIYGDAGHLDRALLHYREAIRYDESGGNLYGAARTRFNVAVALANTGRLADARDYAYAALRNYETFDDRAAAEIQRTHEVIAWIEQLTQAQGGSS